MRDRWQRLLVGMIAITALAVPQRASRAAPTTTDLVVIVHPTNRDNPSASALEKIFLRKEMTWDSGERIIPLNGSLDSERRRRFDRVVLGMSPDEAARYWLDLRIRGGGTAPRDVADAALTVKLIARLAGTVGYVPADTPLAGVRVIARIVNDKVVMP